MATEETATKPLTPAQQKLADRLDAAGKRRKAALALMTSEDIEEQITRDMIAKTEEEEREALNAKRAIDMARRLDACADKIGDASHVRALTVKGFPDFFIVCRNGGAHARWEEGMGKALQNARLDQAEIKLKYARESILEWNGKSLDDTVTTRECNAFLEANPGVVTSVVGEAIELNGAVKEARKSTG